MGRRLALLIATYEYRDVGLRRLQAPAADVEALGAVLSDPEIAGFEVTVLVNQPHHAVGEAIGEFYRGHRRDDLTVLYFTGHGLKDDDGRLYLAMNNTRRESLLFTSISAEQLDQAMQSSRSRQVVLILDCCYSGAFPPGRLAKADTEVHALETLQARGRTVLTASDAMQYSFEGEQLHGVGARSVFTRWLVEGLREGSADLDRDGNITLDELYTYIYERVVEEMPQQRPKKQDNVEGRTIIARNINWRLPDHLRHALNSPIATERLAALDGLEHLYRIGNPFVRERALNEIRRLTDDDSRTVSDAATRLQSLRPPTTKPIHDPATQCPAPSSLTDHPSSAEPNTPRPVGEPAERPPPKTPPQPAATRVPQTAQPSTTHAAVTSPVQGKRAAAGTVRRLSLRAGWPVAVLAILLLSAIVVAVVLVAAPIAALYPPASTRDTPLGTPAPSYPVTATIPVGESPYGVAVAPDGRRAYTANHDAGSVSVIDTASNSVTATIPVGYGSWGVAISPDGRRAYITNHVTNSVSVIDTARNSVTATIPVGRWPWGVAVAPDGRRAYITNHNSGSVSVIDTTSNTVTATIPVSVPWGVAVAPDGRRAYITNRRQGGNSLSVMDTASNTVTATIPVGEDPYGLAVAPDGRRAYVTNSVAASVSVIDTARNSVTATIPAPSGRASGVAVAPDGHRAYITGASQVMVIDTTSNTVTATIAVGASTTGVAVAPDGRRAYTANQFAKSVSVIDIESG